MATPIPVVMEITRSGRLSCAFCHLPKGPSFIELEKFKERLEELKGVKGVRALTLSGEERIAHLILTGGEPLLHPNLKELLSYAAEEAFQVGLQTALYVDKAHVEALLEALEEIRGKTKVWVQISLHAVEVETFKAVTGGRDFSSWQENVLFLTKRLRELDISFVTTTTWYTQSVEEVGDLARWALTLGSNTHRIITAWSPAVGRGGVEVGEEDGEKDEEALVLRLNKELSDEELRKVYIAYPTERGNELYIALDGSTYSSLFHLYSSL